jgi:chemotaxis protein MotA
MVNNGFVERGKTQMFKFNANGLLGFVILIGVLLISVLDRGEGSQISFVEWHAAAIVLGGVSGSLLIALRGQSFVKMIQDWLGVIFGRDVQRQQLSEIKQEIEQIESAWKQGRRAEVLTLAEKASAPEVRVAADCLIQRLSGQRLLERFETLRLDAQSLLLPQIEGWDLVARLAPSFGIVGTVAGMVQLFRNMANNSGNLGGAMALALLATLYGILLGTALGGPMSTRMNQVLTERIGLIDLLEFRVAALIEEDRGK